MPTCVIRTPMLLLLALALAGLTGPARADPSTDLDTLARKYGIKVELCRKDFSIRYLGSRSGRIAGKPPDKAEVKAYTPIFLKEFDIYPVDLIRKSKLQRIVLCSGLNYSGQLRAAVPDLYRDVLYLDVARGNWSKLYVRKVLHHEFFHIIDWRDDGKLYQDKKWARLNPNGFRYRAGGAAAQTDPKESLTTGKLPGFLSKYSTAGVEEDKAEVFAHMMVDYASVWKRAEEDAVLEKKVRRMKSLLNRFSRSMNAEFWKQRAKSGAGDGSRIHTPRKGN